MRAPRNEATGTSGESEVLAEFERLGWGGVLDPRHDTGTDLYLRPRDPRRFELGVLLGAQVKTGPSFFESPTRNEAGEVDGWWFTKADRPHYDYWLRHALPHLIILRDQELNRSYWVHVTADKLVSTGKGTKIHVPISQVVDSAHNNDLADVALTKLPAPAWEGTAWTGAVDLPLDDQLRYALIAPRVIAPHPNIAPESLSGAEALAMQVLLREELFRSMEIDGRFASESARPQWGGLRLEDARLSDDWAWRATAALRDWVYEENAIEIDRLIDLASTPAERAAATILVAVRHFDEGDPDSARGVLDSALNFDDYSPVDHAWIQVQRARAMNEVGAHEEAFDLAISTQRIGREAPTDVTAAGIAGACAVVSFAAADWMNGDIANIVQTNDNAISWWRAQVLSYGLSEHLSEEFREWSGEREATVRLSSVPLATRRLRAASLLASCVGNRDGWCNAFNELAKHVLVTSSIDDDPNVIASWLGRLRLSGDNNGVKYTTKRLIKEGPIQAAQFAAEKIVLSNSTRTTAIADFDLLISAGEVLPTTQADEVCAWALGILRDPQDYVSRVRPSFDIFRRTIELLTSILQSVSIESLRNIIDYVLGLPPVKEGGKAQQLARLVHSIPEKSWCVEDRNRAGERAGNDDTFLREALLGVASPAHPESRQEIMRRAEAGELIILDAISDLRDLTPLAVRALIDTLCAKIEKTIEDSAHGSYAQGGIDYGHALALLNYLHASESRWEPIKDLLGAPTAAPSQKTGALEVLAIHGSEVPHEFQAELVSIASRLRLQKTAEHPLMRGRVDLRSIAVEAMAAMENEESRAALVRELLCGDANQREASAHILGRFDDVARAEILISLAGDSSAHVRDAALGGIAALAAKGEASEGMMNLLSRALLKGATRSAVAIMRSLVDGEKDSSISTLLNLALNHASAQVRRAAGHVMG